jgi:hypothetical protein
VNTERTQWRTIAQDIHAREATRRQRAIGHALKRIFDDAVSEPLPAEFEELLRKIDLKRSVNGERRYDEQQ